MFVTMPKENQTFEKKILDYNPKAKIIITENLGFDIYPFIVFLDTINISDYDLVLKIHTKKNMPIRQYINGYELFGNSWRYFLFSSILGSEDRVQKILHFFEHIPELGLIGSKELLVTGDDVDKDINILSVENIMKQCGLSIKRKEFIAGSVFFIRANILEPLKNRHFTINDFPQYHPRDWNGLPYCIERCFGFFNSSQYYHLLGLPSQNQ